MRSHSDAARARLGAILKGERCVHPATVFDPLSARIAGELGFEAGMLAGSMAALAVLGAPDRRLLTLTELADLCRRVAGASELPIVVDGDHGYGNALNVMRMVEELEHAGIAAVSVEDTVLPLPFGPPEGPPLIPIEEGVGKMRAALAARRDPNFAILGRTGAVASAGLDEAIARGRAYEEAGVDALFYPGIKRTEEVDALSAATTIPLVISGLAPDTLDHDWLAARRARLALPGHRPFFAAYAGFRSALQALRDTGSYAGVDAVSVEEMARWSLDDSYDAAVAAYLRRQGPKED